jgi:nitrogen fixation protein NifB
VAATCNIRCNYCDRRHDCANESRPGVSSVLLTPEEASAHVDQVINQMPWITVAGIAGPGDAFAEPLPTLATLEAVRRRHPALHLCLSTNGLVIRDYIKDLVGLKVGFVTVTVNALDPRVGAQIYGLVHWQGQSLRGEEAAALLLDRQLSAISRLTAAGIAVKVNTVVIPTINTAQCPVIARTVARLGARLHNLIPIIPVQTTPFAALAPPTIEQLEMLRQVGEFHLPQMRHCMRCRADSVGLLAVPSSRQAPCTKVHAISPITMEHTRLANASLLTGTHKKKSTRQLKKLS